MDRLLEVRDLRVCYRKGTEPPTHVVDNASFDLAAGETLGIIGESGCGKTSLALALLGLLPRGGFVQCGEVRFKGTNLIELHEADLQRVRGAEISFVHQDAGLALNPVLRVGDQIAEVLIAHRRISFRQASGEARKILAQIGFAGHEQIDRAFPHQLSGGQKQRVAIAQAIACGPALVIADEPVTALDALVQVEIITLLKTLQQHFHLALILITHTPAVLVPIAHRIMVMYAGRIVEQGLAPEVLQAPLHPYTQGLLDSGLDLLPQESPAGPLSSIPGEPPNLAALPAGCAFAPRCSDRMEVCQTREPVESHSGKSRIVRCIKYE